MDDEDEHNARHRASVAILSLLSLLLESSTFERFVSGNAKRRSELKEVLGNRRDEELMRIDTFSIASMLTSVMADTVRSRDVEDTDSNVAIDFSIQH